MFTRYSSIILTALLVSACSSQEPQSLTGGGGGQMSDAMAETGHAVATFAGGCFWCTESDFEKVPGVIEAVSGYIGGHVTNPTYKQVSSGKTGHVEAVEVTYDPNQVSYEYLLEAYWRHVDPTDGGGQFVDRGYHYRPVIYYHNAVQKEAALDSIDNMMKSGRYNKPIELDVLEVSKFWPAEEYHQDYYKKNPIRYKFYRYNSGRDQYLRKVWGEDLALPEQNATKASQKGDVGMTTKTYSRPSDEEIKGMLTKLQYKVTQHEGTERPFNNEYHDEKREGIYVDIVSGEPLFSSRDKFDSGTGWPSFTQPLESAHIVEKKDYRLIIPRVEVRSKFADSHLGHVFKDGPQPTGLRYCINSAALKFIPKEDLAAEGYEQYASMF